MSFGGPVGVLAYGLTEGARALGVSEVDIHLLSMAPTIAGPKIAIATEAAPALAQFLRSLPPDSCGNCEVSSYSWNRNRSAQSCHSGYYGRPNCGGRRAPQQLLLLEWLPPRRPSLLQVHRLDHRAALVKVPNRGEYPHQSIAELLEVIRTMVTLR